MTRTIHASNDFTADAQSHVTKKTTGGARAINGAGEVSVGTIGSLSASNSPIASRENIATAVVDPMNANGKSWRFNQFRCAPHVTTAGAVSERSPATTPIPRARRKT